jgi:hypothetical protein
MINELLLRIYQSENNKMPHQSLKTIVADAERLELNDLIQIMKVLNEAVAKQRHYQDIIATRQGAPYYT